MRTPEQVSEIVRLLLEEYPEASCTLDYGKDYELLFSVRLAAQCTDERVNRITPALFERFPTLESFAEADVEEVEDYVRSCGFFRSKARDIVACAQVLVSKYGGKVPATMEELTALPGVGRKTANVIQAVAYGRSAMAVDTHVYRVSHRLGLVSKDADTPEKVEKELCRNIPEDDRADAHHWLLLHGRYVCQSRMPLCDRCPFTDICPKLLENSKLR